MSNTKYVPRLPKKKKKKSQIFLWVSISSTNKIYYRQIKYLRFNPYIHQKPITIFGLTIKKNYHRANIISLKYFLVDKLVGCYYICL